jgi:formate dehydrogenase subunit gamma
MKKIAVLLGALAASISSLHATATGSYDSPLYGTAMIKAITHYEAFGEVFTFLQREWFWKGFLIALFLVPIAGGIHYLFIGPKVFSHEGKKIYAFSVLMRVMHNLAALSFLVIVPTGFVMVFGEAFGGGVFVRMCKNLHGLATPVFAITVLPMIIAWIRDMFPNTDDIKWMMIVGGYLSKEKKPVPAGKFNAGQKAWFWIAMPGGIVMILTGALMFFLNSDLSPVASYFGISQIDLLRLSAIVHNILGMVVATFFMVHVYMAAIAIKGAIHSMISGYKEEEEVAILHSSWYKKLKEEGKV